jgi:hypothetical protein
MAKRGAIRTTSIPVTESSGNVFADLGVAEPEEELTKAKLASHIRHTIQQRRLTLKLVGAFLKDWGCDCTCQRPLTCAPTTFHCLPVPDRMDRSILGPPPRTAH